MRFRNEASVKIQTAFRKQIAVAKYKTTLSLEQNFPSIKFYAGKKL